jgi:peptidoglycan/LPS O-acetylase OafA/YrhL
MAALGVLAGYAYVLLSWYLNPDMDGSHADLHASLATNLLLLPKFWTAAVPESELFPLDGAIWSLFFELIMNFLFALFLARLKNSTLLAVMALGAISTFAIAFYQGTFNLGWNWATAIGGFSRALFGFTAGMLIFRNRNRLAFHVRGAGSIVLAALLLLPIADAGNLAMSALAIFIVFPAVMMLGINVQWDGSASLQKLFGNLSYPLYTMHLPVLGVAAAIYKTLFDDASVNLLQPALMATVIAAAYICFYYIDVPVRQHLGRLGKEPQRDRSAANWMEPTEFNPSSMTRK